MAQSRRGWFRLWAVVTVIGVPAAAEWNFQNQQATWDAIEKPMSQLCVEEELNRPSHPDAIECGHQAGTDKTVFEHEGVTPLRFWTETLGIFLLLDLVLAGIVIAGFLVIRWIVRGFKDDQQRQAAKMPAIRQTNDATPK